MPRRAGCPEYQAQSRSRGRPLKEHESTAADLQRARVRRAQKAFRARKENHVNALEEKCRELERVVEEMTNTFIGFSDDLLQSGCADAEVATGLKATLERFLVLSQKAVRELDDESRVAPETSETASPGDGGIIASVPCSNLVLDQRKSSDAVQPIKYQYSNSTSLQRGLGRRTADPYMNNLWGLPIQTSPADGMSAIPYILAGRDSFASRLYFETISLAAQSLTGGVPMDFAASMFRYKLRHASIGKITRVVSGVLNVLLHGTSQMGVRDEDSQQDQDIEKRAKSAIVGEITAHGGSEDDYLATWDVEHYLKDRWALVIDSNTVRIQQRALPRGLLNQSLRYSNELSGSVLAPEPPNNPNMLAPTFIPGFPTNGQIVLSAQPLVEKLTAEAVTIGEGPRWHLANIDAVILEYFEGNEVSG